MAEELESIISAFHPAGTRVAMHAFAEADLREMLPHIAVPTLLVYGEKDVRAPQAVWEPLHSEIPGSQLVLIPDVGHSLDVEAGERLNAEVRAFLRAVEGDWFS